VVSDIVFKLPRQHGGGAERGEGAGGEGGEGAMTQTVHVVNRGTVAVEVARPRVGSAVCGGDGEHGFQVHPCKPLKLPPGGSKQVTNPST